MEEDGHGEPHVFELENQQQHETAEDDKEDQFFRVNINTDHYRLRKAKLAQGTVLGTLDALFTKKTLTATAGPNLITKGLITKIDKLSKVKDLDVSTILAKQNKNPVLGTVRSWIRKRLSPNIESLETLQPKGLLFYCQSFNGPLIETEVQLLC